MRRASSRTAERGAGHRRGRGADARHPARRGPTPSAQATRGSRASTARAGAVLVQDDQVVAVDHLAGEVRRGGPRCAGPATRPAGEAGQRTIPLAKTAPSGPTTSTASSGPKSPVAATTPAASSDRPPSTRARRAPASTTSEPADGRAKAIQSLRAAEPDRAGAGRPCPTPGLAGHRRAQHPGPLAVGDHRLHPRPGGDLGRRQLGGHAAAGRPVPGPPATSSRRASISSTSSISEASSTRRGSAVNRPGGVGEQHQQVGADQVGHQGARAGRCRRSGSPRRPPGRSR